MDSNDSSEPRAREYVYRQPESIFDWVPKPIEDIWESALIVIDTNCLLQPYGTSKESLESVEKAYSTLRDANRLVVPSQVAIEYAFRRQDVIESLINTLTTLRSKFSSLTIDSHPILKGLPEYEELKNLVNDAQKSNSKVVEQLDPVIDQTKKMVEQDPVRAMYARVLSGCVRIYNDDQTSDEKDMKFRYDNKIPPGYKDGKKQDGGVGDYLIWKTILSLGAEKQKHIIFVTGEQKSDWWHRFNGEPLNIRHELIEEFGRESGGKTFRIATMSQLLAWSKAPPSIVSEVAQGELLARQALEESAYGNQSFETREWDEDELLFTKYIETYLAGKFSISKKQLDRLPIDIRMSSRTSDVRYFIDMISLSRFSAQNVTRKSAHGWELAERFSLPGDRRVTYALIVFIHDESARPLISQVPFYREIDTSISSSVDIVPTPVIYVLTLIQLKLMSPYVLEWMFPSK